MRKMISKNIFARIAKWEKERAVFLQRRNQWPVDSMAYVHRNLAYEIWGLKIAIWKEIRTCLQQLKRKGGVYAVGWKPALLDVLKIKSN